MIEITEELCSQVPQSQQTPVGLVEQPGTQRIGPEYPGLRPEVRHFMNQISVLRSTDETKQTELLNQLSQGASGYRRIDFSTPEVVSSAFGLFIDGKISRFQMENLLDAYHSCHLITYNAITRVIITEQHQLPEFFDLFDEEEGLTEVSKRILIEHLIRGRYFATRAEAAEIEEIIDRLKQLPPSERFFYTVNIPENSHAYTISDRAFRILGGFPIQRIQDQIKLTMVSVSVMHAIGDVLFKHSYIPSLILLGEISPTQMTNAMDLGVRLRTSYVPWSNAVSPGSIHRLKRSSVLGVTLHDLYHSMHATKCTKAVGNFCVALSRVIREKMLAQAVWNSPQFLGRAINSQSCHAIWILYEREFYSCLKKAFGEVDLRNTARYKLARVMYEIFYQYAVSFAVESDDHLDLFSNGETKVGLFFSPMGLTLLIDFVMNAKKWGELGFILDDFSPLPRLSNRVSFRKDRKLRPRSEYDINARYQEEVKPYLEYFTGDSIRDYLKYFLFNKTDHSLSYQEINCLINGLDNETIAQFKYRRNNKQKSLHLYCLRQPNRPINAYSSRELLQEFGLQVSEAMQCA